MSTEDEQPAQDEKGHPGSWTFEYELPVRVRVHVQHSAEHDSERAEKHAALLVRTWLPSLPGARFETAELTVRGDADDLVLENDNFEYAPASPESAGARSFTLQAYALQAARAAAPPTTSAEETLAICDAVLDALRRRGVPLTDDQVSNEVVVEQMARALLRNHLKAHGHEPGSHTWQDNPSAHDLWRDQARASLAALHEVLLNQ